MADRSRERCGTVSDWMTRQPATVAPDSSIGAALGRMRRPVSSAQASDEALVGQHAAKVAARGECAAELVGVPPGPRAENRDVHYLDTGPADASALAPLRIFDIA